jgi:two-component system, NtrC family, sensor histidine kinase HydH
MSTRFVFRVTAPLLGVSLLLLLLGAFTAWYVHSMQQQVTSLISKSITTSNAAQSLEDQLRELRTNLSEYSVTADLNYLRVAKAFSASVEEQLSKAEALRYPKDGQPEIAAIRREFAAFQKQFTDCMDAVSSEQMVPLQLAQASLSHELIPRAIQHREAQQTRLEEMSRNGERIADRVSLTLLLLVTFGAIGGLTAGIAVARKVHQSIIELNIPVHAASGMLDEVVGPVNLSTQSNLDEIRESLDKMTNRIGVTVQRLHESQQKILRTEQLAALSQMAAGLAHEIRNPLTAMRSLVQMARLQGGGGAALDQRDIEVLDTEIERLNELVQTFLDFARPPKLMSSRVSISEIVQRTLHLTKHRAERQGVLVEVEAPTQDLSINADPQQMQQVVLNLVLNAIDVQPDGGRVWIRVKRIDATDGLPQVAIMVEDDGPGIPAAVIDRIFEPFFSTKETGTGIGLAICRRIVEDHQGTIAAKNQQQGGALLTVLLPSTECILVTS